jgi:hypothetical protein
MVIKQPKYKPGQWIRNKYEPLIVGHIIKYLNRTEKDWDGKEHWYAIIWYNLNIGLEFPTNRWGAETDQTLDSYELDRTLTVLYGSNKKDVV